MTGLWTIFKLLEEGGSWLSILQLAYVVLKKICRRQITVSRLQMCIMMVVITTTLVWIGMELTGTNTIPKTLQELMIIVDMYVSLGYKMRVIGKPLVNNNFFNDVSYTK